MWSVGPVHSWSVDRGPFTVHCPRSFRVVHWPSSIHGPLTEVRSCGLLTEVGLYGPSTNVHLCGPLIEVHSCVVRCRIQKLAKDLTKYVNCADSGPWPPSRVSALDRSTGELIRILDKKVRYFATRGQPTRILRQFCILRFRCRVCIE